MTMLALLVRFGITAGFLYLILRFIGKRNSGDIGLPLLRVGPLDLMVALMLGGITASTILGQLSLAEGCVALGTVAWMHLLAIILQQRSTRIRRWSWGSPITLVHEGKVQRGALARELITNYQFDALLREAGITRLSDVHELHLEPDSGLSVVWKQKAKPVTYQDCVESEAATEEAEPWRRAA
ncbi:MAG: DUF421 domain-containing protein [Armatimonadota bacterium]